MSGLMQVTQIVTHACLGNVRMIAKCLAIIFYPMKVANANTESVKCVKNGPHWFC